MKAKTGAKIYLAKFVKDDIAPSKKAYSSGDKMNGEPRPMQRRSPRVPIDVRVRLRYEKNRKQQDCHCRSFDISEVGMGLVSPYELEAEQPVELVFSLPGTTAPLRLQAVIRSKIGFRLGCEFISLTQKQKSEIDRYGNAFQLSKRS